MSNPISYTSRTFESIIADINNDSDLVNKPDWWKRIWAGVGDITAMWNNAVANNIHLRTSFTRRGVQDNLKLIDYELSAQSTSSGISIFHVDTSLGTGIFPFTVLREDLIAKSTGTLNVAAKQFEARGSENFTLISDTFTTNFAVNNELTISTDLEYTGHKIRLSSATTLPSPLKDTIDYYVIYVDATHIKLATSLDDAFAGNEVVLSDDGIGVHTLDLFSKVVSAFQQESLESAVVIGVSDGITQWQEFDIPDLLMLEDTLSIVINSVPYTEVTTFIDSSPTDTHFKIITKSEGSFAIQFGNGIYGKIPEAFDIEAFYATGGGEDSNIRTLNTINIYSGSDEKLTGVTNPVVFTGGGDEQDLEEAKILGPLLLKARDRFVTSTDGEAIVLNAGGVSQVKVIKNQFGPLTCQVAGIADGGGDVSAPLRASLQAELINKSILDSIDVRFLPSTITAINVTSAAKMLPGFTFAGSVEDYFELAYNLYLSEAGNEIQSKFISDGIADAITLINSIFGTSFSSSNQTDIDQIQKLLNIETYEPRQFGETINESDVITYVQGGVDGIDYMTITTFGSGLPLVLASDEITTPGALTLTEIP